jgi:2-dehydro-3-deoxygluconokinase
MIFQLSPEKLKDKKFDIVGFGELMVEFDEYSTDPTTGAIMYSQSIGGDVYNTLYAMSLFNKTASFESGIGNDIFKEYILLRLAGLNIDISTIVIDFDYYNGVYFIKDTPDDDRIIQSYREKSAARYVLNENTYSKFFEFAKAAKIFYCTGITLAICERKDLFFKLVEELHNAGVIIAYDTNVRPQLWEGNLRFEKETEEKILPFIDIAMLTKADTLLEINVTTEEELVNYYSSWKIPHLIIKDGANGAVYTNTTDKSTFSVPAEKVNVVDTTGAGDAFNGGFLAGVVEGESVENALKMGIKVATACILVKGAINYKL